MLLSFPPGHPTVARFARADDAERLGDGGLPLKRHPASIRDADINHERQTAVRHRGLGHNSCELGERKAGERLHGEAVS